MVDKRFGRSAGWPVHRWRCGHCGFEAHDPAEGTDPLTVARLVRAREQSTRGSWVRPRLPSTLSARADVRVLDVGCWDGDLLADLPSEWTRIGIEPNDTAANIARARGLDVRTGVVDSNLLRDEAGFDVILMMDVLEHLADPRSVVAVLRELLRERNGYLVALTGDNGCMAARLFGESWYYRQYREHISFFGRRSTGDLLERAGFALVSTERIAHPQAGHIRDMTRGLHKANRGREDLSPSFAVGLNLVTISRLMRGRDHIFVVAQG